MSEKVYQISYALGGNDQTTIDVTRTLKIGSDNNQDVTLPGQDVAPLQGKIRLQGGVLTYTHLTDQGSTLIGPQPCGKGKMYILDEGDVLTVGSISLTIGASAKPSEEPARDQAPQHDIHELTLSDLALDEQTAAHTAPPQQGEETPDQMDDRGFNVREEPDEFDMGDYEPAGQTLVGIEVLKPEDIDKEEVLKESATKIAAQKAAQAKAASPKNAQKPEKKKKNLKSPTQGRKAQQKLSVDKQPKSRRSRSRLAEDKTSEIQRLQKRNKKRRFSPEAAGILARLAAFTHNLLFFGLSFFYTDLYGHPTIQAWARQLQGLVHSRLQALTFIPSWLQELVQHFTFYHFVVSLLLWNMVTALVLGVNAGQFLVGLKAEGRGDLANRLFAPIRTLLSLVTTPLIIFDLPCLVGKRTLKEVLTLTTIVTRSSLITFASSILVLPLLFLGLANYHFIANPHELQQAMRKQVTSHFVDLATRKVDKKDGATQKKWVMRSSALGLEFDATVDQDLYTHPQMTHNPQTNYLTFHTFHEGMGQKITWSARQLFTIQAAQAILKQDPLLFYTFPTLFEQYQSQQNIPLDSAVIIKLFDTLSLKRSEQFKYLKDHGFFLKPTFELLQLFKEKVGATKFYQLKMIKNHYQFYMSFKTQPEKGSDYLITINDLGLTLIEVKANIINQDLTNLFIEQVLATSQPLQMATEQESLLIDDLTKIVDTENRDTLLVKHLTKIMREKTLTNEETAQVIQAYTDLGKNLMTKKGMNHERHLELVLKVFKNNEKALLKVLKENDDKNLSELRLALNRIQKALYKRETEFFNLN